MKPKGIVLIAPPGGGKGTLAKEFMLTKRFHHLSTEDYFRSFFKKQNLSKLEKEILYYMKNNLYVPDDITITLFKNEIQKILLNGFVIEKDYFLLDGIPRTTNQIVPVEEVIDVVKAIYVDVGHSYKEIRNNVVKKLLSRGRNEADRNPKKIITRIRQYFDEGTHNVYEHYKNKGNLMELINTKSKAAYLMTVDRVVESILKTP